MTGGKCSGIPWYHRLLTRLLLFAVLPVALVMAAILLYSVDNRYEGLRSAALAAIGAEAIEAGMLVDRDNALGLEIAEQLVDAATSGMIEDRAMMLAFSRSVLERNVDVTACYYIIKPWVHWKKDDRLPDVVTESGQFAPIWYVDTNRGDVIGLNRIDDMTTVVDFDRIESAFKQSRSKETVISEPFVSEDRLVVDVGAPVVWEGQFAGWAGVNLSLNDQEEQLRTIAKRTGDDMYLLSSTNRFLAATSDETRERERDTAGLLKTTVLENSILKEVSASLEQLRAGEVLEIEDPDSGRRDYWAGASIPTGSWTLLVRRSQETVVGPIRTELTSTGITALVVILGVIALLIWLAIGVSRRISIAMGAVEQVTEGDLSVDVKGSLGSDETGVLLRLMSTMTKSLRGLVGDVRASGGEIEAVARTVGESANEQRTAVYELDTSTQEIAASASEIAATSSELALTIEEVSRHTERMTLVAGRGKRDLEGLDHVMEQLRVGARSVDGGLAEIRDRASSIDSIVATIVHVADQTNLLSVNASIEAVKAGDAGSGFIVVAREIRNLADRAAAATVEIEETLNGIERAVDAGVREMRHFNDRVDRIVHSATQVGAQMGEIMTDVQDNSERFMTVRDGVHQQHEGAEQIREAMQRLSKGASTTSERTREFAAAAERLERATQDLSRAVANFRLQDD